MNARTLLGIATLSVLMISGLASPAAAQGASQTAPIRVVKLKRERHPEIRKAMRALERARNDLRHADRDFGGHRARAANLIDQALTECREAINADKH